ncbi:MAG TPA: response regulator [Pyrinomonadaceae bacterium]|nr:response regulator [Pyrinomonadaceae bacterium]
MAQPLILYVERNYILYQFMRDVFDLAGWKVHHAEGGVIAQKFLESREPYNLLLLDNDLPPSTWAMSGLELVRYARSLPSRKGLPILLYSIEDCAKEAKLAGADEFLRKPHDLHAMVDTIRRLLEEGAKKRVSNLRAARQDKVDD